MKYRAKAIKYVTHLEEVRINAQVEMARLQNQNIAMRLYIDRSFQQSLDYMEDAYLSQSYRIDQTRRQMIQEVNNQVQRHFGNIDRRYIETVRENELKCAMYRDFVNQSVKMGSHSLILQCSLLRSWLTIWIGIIVEQLQVFAMYYTEMMRQNSRVSFEEYLSLEKRLKRL